MVKVSSNGLGEVVRCGKEGCDKTFLSEEEALNHMETEFFDHGDDGHFILRLVRIEEEKVE